MKTKSELLAEIERLSKEISALEARLNNQESEQLYKSFPYERGKLSFYRIT